MSYTPTEWTTGDTITTTKLNKIENGIANAGSVLICTMTYSSSVSNYVLDKTVQEIYDALLGGTPVYVKFQYGVLTSAFTGTIYLAPVVKIFNYAYKDAIRIYAVKPTTYSDMINGKSYPGLPSLITFSAQALNAYPVLHSATMVGADYVVVNTDVL